MIEEVNKVQLTKLGNQLQNNKLVKIGEILILFIFAYTFISLIIPFVGDNPILKQTALWVLILAYAYMDTILMIQMYMASN